MDRGVGAAARLPESDRKDLAIQALARSETVSDLAARHGVSRKFVYQQTHKAVAALDDAFMSATPDDEVLFELAVTKAWLRQVIVGLMAWCMDQPKLFQQLRVHQKRVRGSNRHRSYRNERNLAANCELLSAPLHSCRL